MSIDETFWAIVSVSYTPNELAGLQWWAEQCFSLLDSLPADGDYSRRIFDQNEED